LHSGHTKLRVAPEIHAPQRLRRSYQPLGLAELSASRLQPKAVVLKDQIIYRFSRNDVA